MTRQANSATHCGSRMIELLLATVRYRSESNSHRTLFGQSRSVIRPMSYLVPSGGQRALTSLARWTLSSARKAIEVVQPVGHQVRREAFDVIAQNRRPLGL